MRTEDFDFPLPPELIAQQPAAQRDRSRLMVLDRPTQTIQQKTFADVIDHLSAGDLLVVNDTRVLPVRVFGRKPDTGGRVEFFFLEELAEGEWDVLLRSRRRPKPGDLLEIGRDGSQAILLEDGVGGRARIRLVSPLSARELMDRHGRIPLPPYIRRQKEEGPVALSEGERAALDQQETEDRVRYQTVYAQVPGAVAAPTAGLHFTPELLARLEQKGIRRAAVTLHVGLGTFRPVAVDDIEQHVMEAERYEVSASTAQLVHETRRAGGRVVAVGSTSVRTLEHSAAATGEVQPGTGRTGLFIRPPYTFRVVDAILTNFHLPRSTLLMMMSAFAGREFLLRAYGEAVRAKYRFFSYGDAMLIH